VITIGRFYQQKESCSLTNQKYFLEIAPINDHKRKTLENKVVSLAKNEKKLIQLIKMMAT